MRWLYVLYFLVVAAVTVVLICRDPEMATSLTAQKAMPFNHLILDSDLGEPIWRVGRAQGPVNKDKFLGKYTPGDVREGQALHTYEVLAAPVLGPPQAGFRVLVTVKAAHVKSGAINARQKASLCAGPGDAREIAVVSVICMPGLKDPCQAVVDLSGELLEKFGDRLKDGRAEIVPVAPSCK
jgi:hypothetical protein